MASTLVIIPALNEEESLPGVLSDLRHQAPDCDVLVIDDGSTDRTADVARLAGATIVSLPFNMGVGTALRTGFRYAARNGYQRVVQTDADGQHDARHIGSLLAAIDAGADLVIGSRFLAGDRHYRVEPARRIAMALLRILTRLLTGRQVADSTSGFRAFSRPLVETFGTNYPREFLSDTVEALLMASYAGYEITEVPVKMRERVGGLPSQKSLKLYYHYIRLLVVMALTASLAGRRSARRATSG